MPSEITENVQKEIFDDILKKCKECADELRDLGIDLMGYSSEQSVEDIEDIRKALDYHAISFFGYSYGTTLAQHYIRKYEGNVSKAVMAGVMPPDMVIKAPSSIFSQYEVMDSLLKQDKRFLKYIPSLIDLMNSTHKRLENNPYRIKIPLMNAVSEDDGWFAAMLFKAISLVKPYWNMTLTKDHMRIMMAQNTGTSIWTQRIPYYYWQLQENNAIPIGNYLRNFRRKEFPNALFFTEGGTTGYDLERWDLLRGDTTAFLSHFSTFFGRYPEVYEAFGISKIDGQDRPVKADTELLLIGGTLDGRTPLINMDTIKNRFPNSRQILIHNASHNDLLDAEVLEHMLDFYSEGKDSSVILKRTFHFSNLVDFEHDILDELEERRLSNGIQSVITLYEETAIENQDQNDFIFDLGEATLNNYGYQLLAKNQVDDAIAILKYNTEKFPIAYNTYNSLAEAYLQKADTTKAVQNLKKAISLNYLDGYSHGLLIKIE